jgi:hypothetical protein
MSGGAGPAGQSGPVCGHCERLSSQLARCCDRRPRLNLQLSVSYGFLRLLSADLTGERVEADEPGGDQEDGSHGSRVTERGLAARTPSSDPNASGRPHLGATHRMREWSALGKRHTPLSRASRAIEPLGFASLRSTPVRRCLWRSAFLAEGAPCQRMWVVSDAIAIGLR